MTPIELTRNPIVKATLRARWPQFVIRVIALTGLLFAILAGLIGTPVGNHNFSIVFVWIVWWALLMLFVVPFLGRSWCAVCPIPMPGEWLQNGALLRPRGKGFGLNRTQESLKKSFNLARDRAGDRCAAGGGAGPIEFERDRDSRADGRQRRLDAERS